MSNLFEIGKTSLWDVVYAKQWAYHYNHQSGKTALEFVYCCILNAAHIGLTCTCPARRPPSLTGWFLLLCIWHQRPTGATPGLLQCFQSQAQTLQAVTLN
jgi:hypothetical protein